MSGVIATYLVHDSLTDLHKKAESIALGLTVGSWTSLPQNDQEQLKKHKGEVVHVEYLESDEKTNAFFGNSRTKGQIQIFYPSANFASDFPSILTTVFGKLSLDGEIKLSDLHFTNDIAQKFPGPKYGIQYIREKHQVFDRPLLMSIFKSVIGRDLPYIEKQLRLQALGGVDLIKDDEILYDTKTSLDNRILAGKKVLQEVYETTGQQTSYAVNLTGRTSELRDKARKASELGADALLFNVFSYSVDTLQELCEDNEITVPIMAHPAVSGAIISSEHYGIDVSLLLGKMLRMAGADFVLFPSPYGSVALEKEKAITLAHNLTTESIHLPSFPVPSAGIHPGLVPLLYKDFGLNHIVNAGGGIHGHPNGTSAGGKAFRAAIDATVSGTPLSEYNDDDLQTALRLWGQT